MDPRIREHASLLVHDALELEEGDDVVIKAAPVAQDLVVALHEVIGDVGANPVAQYTNRGGRAVRSYLRAHDGDFETPEHEQALVEAADAHIHIRADENVTETSDVDPERNAAWQQAHRPILNERLTDNWTLTQYPAPANAQLAEMSTEGYENFVWDAVNKDWDEQHEFQEQMVEVLDDADEVRVVSGETTDVRMSVVGNNPINDTCTNNVPGGEVFTAPVPDSVEGEVLDTDEGARRLGELGIGMNRDIDRFTYNMLFDEKMGDTVHMAVGRAYDANVGEDNEQNQSAVHVDMIVDMSEDSYIEVDGEVVQRDGTFRFEDGFEQ